MKMKAHIRNILLWMKQRGATIEFFHLPPQQNAPQTELVNDVSGFETSNTMQHILNAERSDQLRLQNALTDAKLMECSILARRYHLQIQKVQMHQYSSQNAEDLSKVIDHLKNFLSISDVLKSDLK